MGWMALLKLYGAMKRFNQGGEIDQIFQGPWNRDERIGKFFRKLQSVLQGENQRELHHKEAEYLALQNQIHPHFLYNTLEAIRADALLADCEEIADTTEALATFFRYTISNVQEYVTFSDELDHVENYFTVQKCRFGDKISLDVEIENEKLLDAVMPKLILQPLVENAIGHGIEESMGNGRVLIKIENSADTVFLTVRDNGAGMEEEEVEKVNKMLDGIGANRTKNEKQGGIALRNVNSRIRLMMGEAYGIRLYSALGVGTECQITLPLLYTMDFRG